VCHLPAALDEHELRARHLEGAKVIVAPLDGAARRRSRSIRYPQLPQNMKRLEPPVTLGTRPFTLMKYSRQKRKPSGKGNVKQCCRENHASNKGFRTEHHVRIVCRIPMVSVIPQSFPTFAALSCFLLFAVRVQILKRQR
jgi:hypothetical protein